MAAHSAYAWVFSGLLAFSATSLAGSRTLRVPREHSTIQAAVDAATDGDRIVVERGRFCGATVTKRVTLSGRPGATIVGCDQPVLGSGLRMGFFLPDARASGTRVSGFRFDGSGVSNQNLTPVALGVLARQVDDVDVTDNDFLGSVQAVTNTDGSRWRVLRNRIEHLTALTCDGLCTGGDGIVFQQRLRLDVRPRDNIAAFNRIQGRIPDGLNEFSVVGIFALGQSGTWIVGNTLEIPANPKAAGEGDGVELSDQCCGTVVVSTTINSRVLFNDGRRSQVAVRVDVDAHGGPGNLAGAILFGNQGRVVLPPGGATPWFIHRHAAAASTLLPSTGASTEYQFRPAVSW
jgi:hypothetical protein